MKHYWLLCVLSTACVTEPELEESETQAESNSAIANNQPAKNPLGHSTTWSTAGQVDLTGMFFADLGVNERTCGSCHKATEGWTVSAAETRKVFDATGGLDPIFRTNDGTNSPNADVSTEAARRAAYSMLLTRGTIRVGIGIPANAEFALDAVEDPYGFASAAELSLFRRPLPSANLTLIPTVMWDGRVPGVTVTAALGDQSNGATQGHAGRVDPIDQATRDDIVGFESGLFNAQLIMPSAGRLDADGGNGGAAALAGQAFVAGRFNLFDAYATSDNETRRAIFRGQELFNTKAAANGGTCRGCHSAENVGTNKNGTFFNIGVSAGSRRQADQPLYTLRRLSTGEIRQTTDPGRALITGKWTDLERFKVPGLRALGARAPYFHDGSAATLAEVIDFYIEVRGFSFDAAESADLEAFMSAL